MSDTLITLVGGLCREALGQLGPGPSRERVNAAHERLHEPLRVAIAGSVNAGKSTLLNALLGERVAPTEQGECTQVVTWFRPGYPPEAEIVFRDPQRRSLPLELEPGGALPRSLGVDPEAVDHITVRRPNAVLEKMILIDTPGLGSTNTQISARTEQMLGKASLAAAGRADALIYVMTQLVREDDQAAITAFHSQFPNGTGSAVNTVGVLNKADKGGGPRGERLRRAQDTASRYAGRLGTLVNDIVPMVGLLAESSRRLDEDDAAALRSLAALDAGQRERIVDDRQDFLEANVAVAPERRRRLWEMLDAFGLERCLSWVDGGARNASALRGALRETSGIDKLDALVGDTFDHRSGALRVVGVVAELEAVAFSRDPANAATLTWLRGALDDLRLEPAWHELAQMRAMRDAASVGDKLPEHLQLDLRRLATGHDIRERLGVRPTASVAACAQAALGGAARWRTATAEWDDDAPELVRIGRVAQRSFTLLLEQVQR